jgi:hypothetical protein
MDIKEQVCTLEQAEKLAELLGDDAPESLWVWAWSYELDSDGEDVGMILIARQVLSEKPKLHSHRDYASKPIYPAYTGDELGVLLPPNIQNNEFNLKIFKKDDCFIVGYENEGEYPYETPMMPSWAEVESNTEAQAKAGLAICGLESGYIKKENFKYRKKQ